MNLAYTAADTGGIERRYDLGGRIGVRGSHPLPSSQVEPAVSGAWAGSGRMLATQPLAALVHLLWDYTAGPKTAASYPAQGTPATAAYLPELVVGDGYLSRVTIHNTGTSAANVALYLYDRTGTQKLVHPATVPAHAALTLSVADLAPDFSATGGHGTARLSADRPVVALAALHGIDWSDGYVAATGGDTALYDPGALRREASPGVWHGSETVVQNLGASAASVHVEFRRLDGTLTHSLDDTIPPLGAAAYSTLEPGTLDPARFQALVAALGDDWQGTVRVTCTSGQPLAGVGLSRLRSVAPDRLAHSAPRGSDATGGSLVFPDVYRRLTGGSDEQWSAALVHNTTAVAGSVSVEFYAASGARVGDTYVVAIGASGTVRLDLKDGLDLPPAALAALGTGFRGSMYVRPSGGLAVVGVSRVFWAGEGRAAGYAGVAAP